MGWFHQDNTWNIEHYPYWGEDNVLPVLAYLAGPAGSSSCREELGGYAPVTND